MSAHAAKNANVSGWFDGVRHVYPVRVYYEDTDAAGIVITPTTSDLRSGRGRR